MQEHCAFADLSDFSDLGLWCMRLVWPSIWETTGKGQTCDVVPCGPYPHLPPVNP